jgi:hypothetical protein
VVNDSLGQIDDFPDCSILQRFGQLGAMERFAALAGIRVMLGALSGQVSGQF